MGRIGMDGLKKTIRPATAEDLAGIAAIQTASPEASQWAPADYLDLSCLVAIQEGGLAGFLACREVAPDEREILNLAVDPARRRTGVGRALVGAALGSGGRWFLEVRASNIAAIRLYESAGFEVCGRRPGYYQAPAEEAIVMRIFS
jgi:ribosomal-protein-alanine N-acetyltransferase